MPGWTNRGKFMALKRLHDGTALPTNYYIMLVTSATAPSPATNLVSDLTEIAAGNGYTSGGGTGATEGRLALNSTDFDNPVEDDTGNFGAIQIRDIVWTATGGPIPASGGGARYAILTDDNGTIADREVYYSWSLVTSISVSVTQTITLQNLELRLNET